MRKTTLREYGQNLPIGVRSGRVFDKGFDLRPYKSWIDRLLGDWDEANEGKYSQAIKIAARVPKFLSLICSEYGGKAYPLTDKRDSTPEQELSLYQSYYADVMYAYIYTRYKLLGPKMEVPFVCRFEKCKKQQRGVFDLGTLEVDVIDIGDDIECLVDLKEPIKLRDGKQARKVRVHPVPWASMMEPGVFSGQMNQITSAALKGCISGVDCIEGPYQLTQDEIDELDRVDVININRIAGTMAAGIDLETNVECIYCKRNNTGVLDWTFDYFFGSSLLISETANN